MPSKHVYIKDAKNRRCPKGHPLFQTTTVDRGPSESEKCSMCGVTTRGAIFECRVCRFYLDISCVEFPRKIEHPFHPQHSLLLSKTYGEDQGDYWCNCCHRRIQNRPCYKCNWCKFYMDPDCALMKPITIVNEEQHHIQHFTHFHPMVLIIDQVIGDDIQCFACRFPFEDGRAYACTPCKYFLHMLCAKLPQKIKKYPQHPRHTLSLSVEHQNKCDLCSQSDRFLFHCEENCKSFSYRCIVCSFPPPILKYRGHQHLLSFFEELDQVEIDCNTHSTYCKESFVSDDLEGTRSYWLGCIKCGFALHLLCGPLPCTLKVTYHIHPLHLFDSIIDEEEPYDEHYCDACESKRDPRACVYYCEECNYVAHVRCVMSEVIQALKGDVKNVELRTVRRGNLALEMEQKLNNNTGAELEDSKILFLNDILQKLTYDEKNILEQDFYWDPSSDNEQEVGDVTSQLRHTKGSDKSQETFQSIDKKFMEFIHRLHYQTERSKLEPRFLALKLTFVHGYMVPKYLDVVLNNLLDKYGDISGGFESTNIMKSLTFSILCQVMNEMLETQVMVITESHLANWYHKLKFVRARGFLIDFVVANLEEIMLAYFGLQTRSPEENIKTELASIEKKIVDLETEKENHMKRLEKFTRNVHTQSQLEKACKLKASELNRKKAGGNLL